MEESLPQRIKAVLFDLDGTLRLNLPSSGEVFAECTKNLGIEFSEENRTRGERWEHFYFANSLEIKADLKKFKDDQKGFWVNFTQRQLVALGLHKKEALDLAPRLSDCMGANFKPKGYLPDGTHDLLNHLRERGIVLGVVSNRDDPFHDELELLGVKDYFGFSLAGGEVQSFKPDARIFERALELAGTSAHETMYVGDNYFADVVGSHRAGLVPVLFDPNLLFPEAECAIIRSFDELRSLLQ